MMEVTHFELQGEGFFTGQVHADTLVPHGSGRMEYFSFGNHNHNNYNPEEDDVVMYEGQWEWGQWHGPNGVLQFRNGDSYIGAFYQNARHGQGLYLWGDGRCYEGEFQHNQRHGKGTFTFADGAVYQGRFVKGRRQGNGRYNFPNGNSYEGEWVAGEYEGFGVFTWRDGRMYRGEWKASKHHGRGVEFDAFGQIVHEGMWVDHQPLRKPSHIMTTRGERGPSHNIPVYYPQEVTSSNYFASSTNNNNHTIPAHPQEIVFSNDSSINDDCSELGIMSVVEASSQQLPIPLRRKVTPPNERSRPAVRPSPRPIVLDSNFDMRPQRTPPQVNNRGPARTPQQQQQQQQQVYRNAPRPAGYPQGLQAHSISVGPTRTEEVYRFEAKPPPAAGAQGPVNHWGQHSKQKSQGENPASVPFEGHPQISALIQEQRDALAKYNASAHRSEGQPQQQQQQHNTPRPAYVGSSYFRR